MKKVLLTAIFSTLLFQQAIAIEAQNTPAPAPNNDIQYNNNALPINIYLLNEKIQKIQNNIDVHEEKYLATKANLDKLDDTVWNYFLYATQIFMGVFGLAIASGGIFIWREQSAINKRLEVEEKEISLKKEMLNNTFNEVMTNINETKKEISISLDSLKRRTNIEIKIQSNSISDDEVYVDIRQLSQFINHENYTTLKRLHTSNLLSTKLNEELFEILEKFKIKLKTNEKHDRHNSALDRYTKTGVVAPVTF